MKRTLMSVLAAGTVASLAALTACSPSSAEGESTGGSAGTVRVAVLGSASDTLDITTAATNMPFAIGYNLYDSLVLLEGGDVIYQLAESITPSSDATEWTITVRDGVTFHDGTPLTADDVLYSLRYQGTSAVYGSIFADVDFDASTSDGEDEVILHLTRPRADFVEGVLAQVNFVFPDGTTDFSEGVGSGPFKLESFSADTGTVLVRNDAYWGGAPLLDEIDFLPVADASARLAALRDGQVDLALGLTATGADTIAEGSGLTVVDDGIRASSAFTFSLNTTIAPFDDAEVREAFKLAIDREQLVQTVFRGHGEIGNDVVGKGLAGYDDDLEQRAYDPDRARELFAAHGVTQLEVLAAELTPGILDASAVVEQQLADVGVDLVITEADPTTIYNDLGRVQSSQIFASYLINRPVAATLPSYTAADSAYNFSGWRDTEYNDLLTKSQSTVDDTERQEILDAAQQRLWALGGDVVWGFQSELFAHRDDLEGVHISQSMPRFQSATYVP